MSAWKSQPRRVKRKWDYKAKREITQSPYGFLPAMPGLPERVRVTARDVTTDGPALRAGRESDVSQDPLEGEAKRDAQRTDHGATVAESPT